MVSWSDRKRGDSCTLYKIGAKFACEVVYREQVNTSRGLGLGELANRFSAGNGVVTSYGYVWCSKLATTCKRTKLDRETENEKRM